MIENKTPQFSEKLRTEKYLKLGRIFSLILRIDCLFRQS
jgi:hypothetical protein